MKSDDELTMGQIVERSGLAASAIRHYESLGLIRSRRTAGNQRRFPRRELRRLAVIRTGQSLGRSLDEIGRVLDSLPEDHAPTDDDWAAVAGAWAQQLDAHIEALNALRHQLDSCIGCGCLSLERCGIYNSGDAAAAFGAGPRFLLGDRSVSRDQNGRRGS